jgi:hypothetical protein
MPFEESQSFVVAAALQIVVQPGINRRGEMRLELDYFFRSRLEAFEVDCGVFLPGFVVGDHGEPFPQGIGEGEIGVCGFHGE